MDDKWPKVTIIVPTKPGQAEIAAVTASRALDYPPDRLEIIVARGRQPAVQRNSAIRKANGEIIYFLDDDAQPRKDALKRAVTHFQKESVVMVGGPNLCPVDAPVIERVFAVVLSSWLAFGPSRARYDGFGEVRESSEKELILCNLAARRNPVLDAGGFDESLYPNEENALMDELQKRGGALLHDPDLVVYRRPRGTISAFFRMLLNYGRGRAEQFRLHPSLGSVLNFVPPLFCLYLLLLPLLILKVLGPLALIPLGFYLVAVLGQSTVSVLNGGGMLGVMAIPFVISTHLFYGLGFWRGLFTRPNRITEKTAEVVLEHIASGD